MKRILLVTNSALTREVMIGPLEDRGWEVTMDESTCEAVGASRGQAVDLVLIDLDWPGDSGWSGWELIKGARATEPSVPVVLITGRGELAEAARAAGASGLAEKPVDVAGLLEVVARLAQERGKAGNREPAAQDFHFEHIPADGAALRSAILARFQRPFLASNHYDHWGLNE
jgi:CheY-like chemotaxis protein